MGFPWECVVEIARKQGDSHVCLGTGTWITPTRILTAKHVVLKSDGNPRSEIRVRLDKTERYVPARVEWSGDDDLDVAVLVPETNLTLDQFASILRRLSDRTIQAGERWAALGYAEVDKANPRQNANKYGETTMEWTVNEEFIILKETVNPDSWRGHSGAVVVIGDEIVGVMRSVETNHADKRLRATPVAKFLHLPAFRNAVGLDDVDNELREDMKRRKAKIATMLQSNRDLSVKIAAKFPSTDPTPNALAHALLTFDVVERASYLAKLHKSLPESATRADLREIAWYALPAIEDSRRHIRSAKQGVGPDGKKPVVLDVETETMAEIILAGVDGRACRFASDGDIPQGTGRVRVPSSEFAPFFDSDAEGMAETVLHNLRSEFNDLKSRWCSSLPSPDVRKWAQAVDIRLRRSADDEDIRLRYYFTFMDQLLHGRETTNADIRWTQTCEALGKYLPNLRVVRIKGNDDSSFEMEIAEDISTILKHVG